MLGPRRLGRALLPPRGLSRELHRSPQPSFPRRVPWRPELALPGGCPHHGWRLHPAPRAASPGFVLAESALLGFPHFSEVLREMGVEKEEPVAQLREGSQVVSHCTTGGPGFAGKRSLTGFSVCVDPRVLALHLPEAVPGREVP